MASSHPRPQVQPQAGAPIADFVDVASRTGLTAKTTLGGEISKHHINEMTGGGVALIDFDNDGWLDIFLVNGGPTDARTGLPSTNHLYRNNHDGTFIDVTEKAGLVRHGWGQGISVGDYNGDGLPDLFVTYYGKNVLYRNNGDGTFSDVTAAAGLLTLDNLTVLAPHLWTLIGMGISTSLWRITSPTTRRPHTMRSMAIAANGAGSRCSAVHAGSRVQGIRCIGIAATAPSKMSPSEPD